MSKITRILKFPDMITDFFKSSTEQKTILKNYKDNGSVLTDDFIDNRLTDLTATYITTWVSQEALDEFSNLPQVVDNRKNRTDFFKEHNITITETIEVI